MSDRFEYPSDTLGADLYWWRETGTLHTLVSLYWKEHARLQGAVLRFMLFAESGRRVAEWQVEPVEDQVMLVDSKTPPDVVSAAPTIASGVLAVFVSATGGVGRDDYQHRHTALFVSLSTGCFRRRRRSWAPAASGWSSSRATTTWPRFRSHDTPTRSPPSISWR